MPPRRGRRRGEAAAPSCLDPLSRLNHDVVHMVLSYLDIHDIFRLETVSRTWRDTVRDWMRRFGTRYLIQPTWHPRRLAEPMKPLPYDEFRMHARTIHRTQAGLLCSAHKFEDTAFFSVGGQYAAWVLESDVSNRRRHHYTIYSTPSDIIYWRSMAAGGPKLAIKTVSAARLWRVGSSDGVVVKSLLLNEDGVLFVSVKYGYPHAKGERDVVYSLAHDKILWSRDRDLYSPQTFMPFAIGTSHIYAASYSHPEQRYVLVAENFRTEKRRYASSDLPLNWPLVAYPHFHDFQSFGIEFARVVRISNGGEELILQLKPSGDGSTCEIEIIRGNDGKLLGCVSSTGGTGLNCAASHPPTGHVAFTTEVTRLPVKVHALLADFGRYRVFITRRFSCNSSPDGLCLVALDVVLVHKDWLIRPNYRLESLVVIDPFNRTAYVSSAQKSSEEHSNSSWTLWSCPLVRTYDSGLCDAALGAIPHGLVDTKAAEDSAVVSQCYVLDEGSKVTLSAKPEKGRKKREALELPEPIGMWYGRVVGGQVSLFLEDDHYILNSV
ncbi:hypothetical protein BJX65DRAFT_276537 [Aspergillus insuetus]